MLLRLTTTSGWLGRISNLNVPSRSVPPAIMAALPFCISAAASSSVLAFTCANFFHVFIVFLLYLSQSFEDFVRSGGKVKDPFACSVVYGGRSDSGKARADVFAHA